jgi:hypothetical protein
MSLHKGSAEPNFGKHDGRAALKYRCEPSSTNATAKSKSPVELFEF